MPPTIIRTAPSVADYTPLEEHQARTPETFFGGKPVLHGHVAGAAAWLPRSERAGLSAIFPSESPNAPGQENVMSQNVDVFVGSDFFTLFNHSNDSGIQIPYQSVTLHAVKKVVYTGGADPTPAIYMQLTISPEDDEFETAGLTIIPPVDSDPVATMTAAGLFTAISDCSNLHPDPVPEGEDEDYEEDDRIVFDSSNTLEGYSGVFTGASDGGLPPPMPGSGGWITAENVHEYFDADGNFIDNQDGDGEEAEELGEGAGRIRGRDEVEADEKRTNGTNNGDDDVESKRARVE